VKTYVVRLLGKLGVEDRTAAVAVAVQRGIITL
jgi:DNA-binding NarL/FixJ family response regulator